MNKYHKNARDKGFHDNDMLDTFFELPTPIQRIAYCGLILSESPEIEEALFVAALDEHAHDIGLYLYAWHVQPSGKPTGFLSEFVDVWIRCADVLGACHEALDGPVAELPEYLAGRKAEDAIDKLLGLTVESARKGNLEEYAARIRLVMQLSREGAEFWSKALRVSELVPSFDDAIEIKHQYNVTRPRKHGKLA